MKIIFKYNDAFETIITTFNNLVSNPFNIGDVVRFNVNNIHVDEVGSFQESYRKKVVESNNKKIELFNDKYLRIVYGKKYVSFKGNQEPELTIEYFCEYY